MISIGPVEIGFGMVLLAVIFMAMIVVAAILLPHLKHDEEAISSKEKISLAEVQALVQKWDQKVRVFGGPNAGKLRLKLNRLASAVANELPVKLTNGDKKSGRLF